ncbi:MAG: hypothetical protein JXR83_23755 [Deltaproteobacteria bacterium]|nr:hypothetical protein [Deltaproteobacteria bacterium]
MRCARVSIVSLALVSGAALAAASVAADPKVYAGAECCACLQIKSPANEDLTSRPLDERSAANCLPGNNEASETCTSEVASQIDSATGGDPVRVLDPACYETSCKQECASARENGITFTVSDGT